MSSPAASSPERIAALAPYQTLLRTRNRLARFLTTAMLLGYFGFIGLVAFKKDVLAIPLADGLTTTVGFAIALGLMALSLGTTAWYVYVANTRFDALTRQIVEAAK